MHTLIQSSSSKLVEVAIAIKVTFRPKVTRTRHTATRNINIINRDVTAASAAAQYVVVPPFLGGCTGYISNSDILNHNTVSRVASRTTIEVILLDIDSVDGNVLHADVLKQNVGNEASGVGVRLDSSSVLGVQNDGVGEGDVGYVVV